MKKRLLTAILLTSGMVQADENPVYGFMATGISQSNIEFAMDEQQFKTQAAPHFELGLGKTNQLNEDWTLDNKLSFRYNKADIRGLQGNYTQQGLWLTTTLKNHNLLNFATPFIEVGVGAVDTSLNMAAQHNSEQFVAYEVSAGLEFEVTDWFSISFAVSNSNDDDKDLAPWFRH